jgi:hypothetical protein
MISLKGLLLPRIIGGDLMDEIPVHLAFDWCVVALYSLILQGGSSADSWSSVYSLIFDNIVGQELLVDKQTCQFLCHFEIW